MTRVDEKSGKPLYSIVRRLAFLLIDADKTADALTLLPHLILASPEHRILASDFQATVTNLRSTLSVSITEAWRDRDLILEGVVESGGMGLGGDPAKSLEAVMPVITEWKGLGVLVKTA